MRQRCRILRHKRHCNFVPIFVLEFFPRGNDTWMIMTERQRAEPAEEIQDFLAVAGDVIHAFRVIDDDLVEPEQFHKMQLAGVQMRREQIDNP